MKKLLGGIAISALLAAPALAADLPARMPVKAPPPVVAAAYNWTGCYIGAHVGGAWTDSDWVSVGGVNAHPDGDGIVAGGHVGCNYQVNAIVFGVEGDISWTNLSASGPWSAPGFTASYETDYLASVRGRLGVAFNQFLIYATGGAAFAKWEYHTVPCGCTGTFDSSRVGWVVGGGAEYAFNQNWIARVEGLYYDFGSVTSPAGSLDSVATNLETQVVVVRGALSYKFGGPVVARY